MRVIRLINGIHYDKRRREFKSLAFKPSSNGGISVVSSECVEKTGNTACQHIGVYYSHVSGVPPIYWEFESEGVLPSEARIIQEDSDSGDVCHHDIFDVSPNKARKIFKNQKPFSDFVICEPSGPRILEPSDLEG